MSFQVSDKVVCVDDTFHDLALEVFSELPIRGQIYVVRFVRMGIKPPVPSCGLVGIYGKEHPLYTGYEYGFRQDHFRKLEEIKEQNRITNHTYA